MSSTSTVPEGSGALAPDPKLKRRGRRAAGLIVVVCAIAVVAAWAGGVFSEHPARTHGVSDNSDPVSIATVTKGTLSSQLSADGTLEYTTSGGSDYSVVNQASGTFTSLPRAGVVFSRGQVLYRVDNKPVALLYGSTPIYRALSEDDSGPDVRELNANLVALGYSHYADLDATSDYLSAATKYALELWQKHLGLNETGTLSLGQVVFLPGQLRVTTVNATLGTNAGPGASIIQATSTSRQVVVNLDASEQTEVKVGDNVSITLPDGNATAGVISSIGTVATSSGASATSALPLYITLKHPQAAGRLDDAPVTVQITSAQVKHALIVPIDALLALSGGGYAVETVDATGVHMLVAVTLGTFDDAAGNVQVTGDLHPGERIVVPNI